jgi:hypothetical protein
LGHACVGTTVIIDCSAANNTRGLDAGHCPVLSPPDPPPPGGPVIGGGKSLSIPAADAAWSAPPIEPGQDERSMDRHSSIPPAPPRCSAHIEHQPDGLAIIFPPLGWRAAGIFPLVWTASWNLHTIPFAIVFYILALAKGVASFCNPPSQWWLLFPLPFLLIGLLSVWGLYRLGRREAVIVLDSEKLKIASIGVFGPRTVQWNREDVVEIAARDDGSENSSLELQFLSRSGLMFRLLAGRGESDLKWAASVLRRLLGLPPP